MRAASDLASWTLTAGKVLNKASVETMLKPAALLSKSELYRDYRYAIQLARLRAIVEAEAERIR
jgi:hypothetical protein